MAKYLGIDKLVNFLRIIRDNGGPLGCIRTLYSSAKRGIGSGRSHVCRCAGDDIFCLRKSRVLDRTDDLKTGTLVGEDKYGNKYFENNYYFYGRNRWVIYDERVGMNYDGSQVPAEWFGWLHYKTDLPPHKDPNRPQYKWMLDHKPNLSGTREAYMPYSTTAPKVQPWKPS